MLWTDENLNGDCSRWRRRGAGSRRSARSDRRGSARCMSICASVASLTFGSRLSLQRRRADGPSRHRAGSARPVKRAVAGSDSHAVWRSRPWWSLPHVARAQRARPLVAVRWAISASCGSSWHGIERRVPDLRRPGGRSGHNNFMLDNESTGYPSKRSHPEVAFSRGDRRADVRGWAACRALGVGVAARRGVGG